MTRAIEGTEYEAAGSMLRAQICGSLSRMILVLHSKHGRDLSRNLVKVKLTLLTAVSSKESTTMKKELLPLVNYRQRTSYTPKLLGLSRPFLPRSQEFSRRQTPNWQGLSNSPPCRTSKFSISKNRKLFCSK